MPAEYDRAENASPRSGGNKKIVPIVLAVIVMVAVAVVVWLKAQT